MAIFRLLLVVEIIGVAKQRTEGTAKPNPLRLQEAGTWDLMASTCVDRLRESQTRSKYLSRPAPANRTSPLPAKKARISLRVTSESSVLRINPQRPDS